MEVRFDDFLKETKGHGLPLDTGLNIQKTLQSLNDTKVKIRMATGVQGINFVMGGTVKIDKKSDTLYIIGGDCSFSIQLHRIIDIEKGKNEEGDYLMVTMPTADNENDSPIFIYTKV